MGVCINEKISYDENQMNINSAWEKSMRKTLSLKDKEIEEKVKKLKEELTYERSYEYDEDTRQLWVKEGVIDKVFTIQDDGEKNED